MQPLKVETPLEDVTGLVVQDNWPDPDVRFRAIEALVPETGLPPESSTLTTGWVVNATPSTVPDGAVVKLSWLAAPAVRVNVVVSVVNEPLEAVRVNEPAVPTMEHPEKVAMPLTAATGLALQVRVPEPEVTARVTEAVDVVTVLPPESWTATTGWVVNATPLTAPAASVRTLRAAAAPAVKVMALVVA